MILSVHILTGASIAARFQNPILGVFLAFLSHYLLDIPPHKEYSIENIKGSRWKQSYLDFTKAFLDAAVAFTAIYFLVGNNLAAYFGALAAIIPDGLTLLHIVFPQNHLLLRHFSLHGKFNEIGEKFKIHAAFRIISQLTIAAISIYFLLQP